MGWRVLYQTESPISGSIDVISDGRERRLRVNGITQSSDFLDGRFIGYWSALVPDQPVKNVLLLGLGGGTVVKILQQRWPNAKVTAYELDPEVVRVANDYFGLPPSASIIIGNASNAFKNDTKYDLVIVDLYLGNVADSFSETPEFLREVYDHLVEGGRASFNKYYGSRDRKRLSGVVDQTKQIFPEVWLQQNEKNMVVWAKK